MMKPERGGLALSPAALTEMPLLGGSNAGAERGENGSINP
jgi:hypothetical protein